MLCKTGCVSRRGGLSSGLLAIAILASGCSSHSASGSKLTTTTSSVSTSTTTVSGLSIQQVNWSKVTYPVACPPEQPATEEQVAYTTLPSHVAVALVLVQCSVEDGTGGGALLLFDDPTSPTTAYLMQTLLNSSDGWIPGASAVTPGTRFLTVIPNRVRLEVAGYTGNDARCCSTVFSTLAWSWDGRSYVETITEPAHL